MTGVRARAGEPGVDSELSASSDEAEAAAVVGAGTSAEPEASSYHETPKETDAPSSFVVDPEGVPISVCSSSYWEAVTTPDATLLGVALVAPEAREGVEVFEGTYSGSRSSSEPMTMRADGATDFDHPRAWTRSCLGVIIDCTCKVSLLVLEGANKTIKTTKNK